MSFYSGLITSKLKETKEFYTETLGFLVKFENEWFLLLEKDERELAFMMPKLDFQHEIFQSELEGKGAWITMESADIEKEYERIKNAEIPILIDLRTEEWGETHFSIIDPNGIGIDFVKYQLPE